MTTHRKLTLGTLTYSFIVELLPTMTRLSAASRHSRKMLIEAYIEALLVDEELADMVWEAWVGGQISDQAVKDIWDAIAEESAMLGA